MDQWNQKKHQGGQLHQCAECITSASDDIWPALQATLPGGSRAQAPPSTAPTSGVLYSHSFSLSLNLPILSGIPATSPPPADCIPTKKTQVSNEVSSLSVSATHQAAPDLKNLQLPDARSLAVAPVKMLKMANTGRPSGWPFKGRLVGGGPKLPLSKRSQMLAEKGKEKVEKEKQARENDTHQINAGLMRDLLGAAGKHTPSQTSSTAVTACTAATQSCKTTIPDSGEQEMEAGEEEDSALLEKSSDESSDELQPPAKVLKLEVKLKNVGVPVHQVPGADDGDVLAVQNVSLGDPTQECEHCKFAKHTCQICGKVRCTQYHLNTNDDGESFICSICDPTIVGICGPTLCRVPGEVPAKMLSDQLNHTRVPEKEAPSVKAADTVPSTLNETEQDQGCMNQLVTSSPTHSNSSASDSRRTPGTPRTPRAAIHTPKSTPVRVPVRAPVFDDPACLPVAHKKSLCDGPMQEDAIDLRSPAKASYPEQVPKEALQDQPEPVPELNQDLLEQPAPVPEDLDQLTYDEEPEPQVAFLPGSVHNVDYLGLSGNTHWDEKVLKNSFFMAEGTKTVCLRSAVSIPMEDIFSYIYNKMGLNMADPILSFKGQVVDLQDAISAFPQCATFLIHDGHIP